MIHVVVVSPLPAVRAGLRALLGEATDLQVVGDAAVIDGILGRGLAAAPRGAVDVVVVDPPATFDAGELTGLGEAEGVGRRPGLVILGPVPSDDRLPVELAGVPWAYLPREAPGDQLIAAIRAVASGLTAIDVAMGSHLLARSGVAPRDTLPAADAQELTGREREVLPLVAEGLANKAIARRLGISEHTVKFHVASILAKLGAGSRTEAVHLGVRRGLVTL